MGKAQGSHSVESKTRGQILHDSTYMRYLKWSNAWKQKAEWQLPGSRGKRSHHLGEAGQQH